MSEMILEQIKSEKIVYLFSQKFDPEEAIRASLKILDYSEKTIERVLDKKMWQMEEREKIRVPWSNKVAKVYEIIVKLRKKVIINYCVAPDCLPLKVEEKRLYTYKVTRVEAYIPYMLYLKFYRAKAMTYYEMTVDHIVKHLPTVFKLKKEVVKIVPKELANCLVELEDKDKYCWDRRFEKWIGYSHDDLLKINPVLAARFMRIYYEIINLPQGFRKQIYQAIEKLREEINSPEKLCDEILRILPRYKVAAVTFSRGEE